MSITQAGHTAGAALMSNQRQLDMISQNIDGAQDPNYTRRELRTSSIVASNGQILGSRVYLERISNAPLQAGFWQANATLARTDVLQNSLNLLVNSVGGVDDDSSLAGRMGSFRTALEQAADTPENVTQLDAVVMNAKSVAANLRDLAAQIQSGRLDADKRIVSEVNGLKADLVEFQTVTADLASIGGKGGDANGLLDKRDAILSSINERLPVKMYTDSEGHTTLYSTDSGAILFDNRIANITFNGTGQIVPNDVYAPARAAVNTPYVRTLSGLQIDTVDATPFPTNNRGLVNGRLGALFELRDKTLPALQRHVDAAASSLIRTFRAADTTVAANTDSLFTGFQTSSNPLSTADEQLGVAMQIAVNPLFDNDVGGSATRVRDGAGATNVGPTGSATILNSFIGALQNPTTYPTGTTGSDTQSPISSINDLHTRMQSVAANATNAHTTAQSRQGTLSSAYHNATGVNIDDQLQKMQEVQQLYSANATIIRTIGEMLDALLTAIR